MSTTCRISWVFICLALFTATNALRGALFRTGKRLWSSDEYDPYMSLFKPSRSVEMLDVVDYKDGNRKAMSNIRDIKKTVYLK
ncbi:FMRFamide-like neuropeptide [Dirofilaria immitis]